MRERLTISDEQEHVLSLAQADRFTDEPVRNCRRTAIISELRGVRSWLRTEKKSELHNG